MDTSYTVLPFLVSIILALSAMPLHVWKVTRRGCGTEHARPFRRRLEDLVAAVTTGWRLRWGHVLALALVMVAVYATLAPPEASAGLLSAVVIATPAKTLRDELAEAKSKAAAIMAVAEKENREWTDEERTQIQAHLDTAKTVKAKIDRLDGDAAMRAQIDALGSGQSEQPAAPRKNGRLLSLGEQFVQSEAGQWLRKETHRKGTGWRSPTAELLEPQFQNTTLSSDGSSGGDLIVSDYRPGIVPLLFRRVMVTDLIAPGTTDSNSVTYMKETTFTNAAAAVSEGGTKPESTLVFDQVTDNVRKIAHWLPVTDEMLDDVAGLASYIDARLRLGLDLTEEDQLLNGDGIAPNILGLMNRSGLATAVVRSGSTTTEDAIFQQIMAIMTSAFVIPDGIVMHTSEWQTVVLRKDGNGHYFAGGPFNSPPTPVLWGLPAAVTPLIADGSALVGAYRQASQFFRKGQTTVEASNSHSDYFIKNLTAIRAERRGALAVYRPGAFGQVTSLT